MSIFSSLMRKKVQCQHCGRTIYARRLQPQSTIASGSDPRIWQNDLALTCTRCGKVTCNTCARKAAQAIAEEKPICPACSGTLR